MCTVKLLRDALKDRGKSLGTQTLKDPSLKKNNLFALKAKPRSVKALLLNKVFLL